MAGGGGISPTLSMRRSGQSGDKVPVVGGAWLVVYTESDTVPFLFAGGKVGLANLQAGDTLEIRTRTVGVQGGAWQPEDFQTYSGAAPTNYQVARIGAVANVYGVEISVRQTAGVARTLPCEFIVFK